MIWIIGQILGFLIIAKQQDTYGRKNTFAIHMFLNFLSHLSLLLLPMTNLPLLKCLYGIMFLNGVSTSGRLITGYTYLLEFYPEKSYSTVGTIHLVCELLPGLLIVIYFAFISKTWQWILVWSSSVNIIMLITGLLVLPESAKWLYNKKRYNDCRQVLKSMAKTNGVQDHRIIDSL